MSYVSASKSRTKKAYRTPTTPGNPEWKWDLVSMEFVVGLPLTQRKNNMIWAIMDRLMKTAHFIAMRNTWTLDQLARAYLEDLVRLYGLPSSIVSDWNTMF